jgi:hypothetical protein
MAGQAEYEIAQALQRMRRKPGVGWRKEIGALASYLLKGERARSMFRINHTDTMGLLVVTDRRLIFVSNIGGHTFKEWDLGEVRSAIVAKGFLSSGCDVYMLTGPHIEFRDMDHQEAADLAGALNSQAANS